MPTYISLLRWTQQGSENLKKSPDRLDAAKQVFRDQGGELKGFYLVMGQYDMVIVAEAPNDEAVAKAILAIGSKGAVHSETMRAFTEEEYRNIIGAVR
jgi:uncharacterized protein with GYD domain